MHLKPKLARQASSQQARSLSTPAQTSTLRPMRHSSWPIVILVIISAHLTLVRCNSGPPGASLASAAGNPQLLAVELQHPVSNLSSLSGAASIPSYQPQFNTSLSTHHQQQQPVHSLHGSSQRLQRYLNERQHELVKRYPGSLMAVARAFKMTIVECQYQMRHEHWDCPTFGFSTKPMDIFGKLMSRSFKETSFIHSLLSAAIAHSVTRACTESTISSCGRLQTHDGSWKENFEFGRDFAQQFMLATHESMTDQHSSHHHNHQQRQHSDSIKTRSIDPNSNSNHIPAPGEPKKTLAGSQANGAEPSNMIHPAVHQNSLDRHRHSSQLESPVRRRMRDYINDHNDQVGRLYVQDGMKRECKCHGLSGACNMQSCWLKLPPFREVADKLHQSLEEAVRVIYMANPAKSLTSVKKSNKKRSSIQPVSLSRSSVSSASSSSSPNSNPNPFSYSYESSNSLISDRASIIGSRRRGAKRHTESDNCEDCYRAPVVGSRINGVSQPQESDASGIQSVRDYNVANSSNNSTTVTKRKPIARSIGIAAYGVLVPSKFDLLYYEESPDFCEPSDRFNIKGTKTRVCSEDPNAKNNCKRLCCERGYKTEVREEKYKCECEFKFCCQLDCKQCTRRKVIHKCL